MQSKCYVFNSEQLSLIESAVGMQLAAGCSQASVGEKAATRVKLVHLWIKMTNIVQLKNSKDDIHLSLP